MVLMIFLDFMRVLLEKQGDREVTCRDFLGERWQFRG